MTKQDTQERKLRTRTLIQAGGLLSLSGLLQICDILEGEDLQNDLDGHEKAATLLGILLDARDCLIENDSPADMEIFKKYGIARLKQTSAKYYQNN